MLTQEIVTAEAIPIPSLRPKKTLRRGIEKSTGDCLIPIPMKISINVEKKMKSKVATKGKRSESWTGTKSQFTRSQLTAVAEPAEKRDLKHVRTEAESKSECEIDLLIPIP